MLSSKPSSSKGAGPNKKHITDHQPSSSFTPILEQDHSSPSQINNMHQFGGTITKHTIYSSTTSNEEDGTPLHHSKNTGDLSSFLASATTSIDTALSTDELNRLIGYNQCYIHQPHHQLLPLPPQSQLLPLNSMPITLPAIADKLWEWNLLPETGRDYSSFK